MSDTVALHNRPGMLLFCAAFHDLTASSIESLSMLPYRVVWSKHQTTHVALVVELTSATYPVHCTGSQPASSLLPAGVSDCSHAACCGSLSLWLCCAMLLCQVRAPEQLGCVYASDWRHHHDSW